MVALEYHGRTMRWDPTRVRTVTEAGPCEADEPEGSTASDLLDLLTHYSLLVELQPGDGTRYTLFLSLGRGEKPLVAVQAGGAGYDRGGAPAGNAWTQLLLDWWTDELLARGGGARRVR